MKIPMTAAIRVLKREKVDYQAHLYPYEPRGGAAASSQALGVPLEQVAKTLVFEDERRQPLLVLMQGHLEVSVKTLARTLGVKTIQPCKPEIAQKHSGYLVGGTSPFGIKKPMPVYMETGIAQLPKIYINGGKRGFLVAIKPEDLIRILKPTTVSVGIESRG